LLLASIPAAANGRFPASNQLVFSPTNPNIMVLRTSYGILPSHDNGASWSFVCEDALGFSSSATEDPSIGLTANNSLIAGIFSPGGLNVSPDVGCNWNCQGGPLQGLLVVDVAVRPDNAASAVALAGQYVPTDAGGEQLPAQVFETTDNGMTWAALGKTLDPTVIPQTIDVAKTDPNRIYVSGARGFGTMKTAVLLVSTDKGNTWSEKDLPSAQYDPTTEDTVFIGAIDPTNADRVYIRSSGLLTGGLSRLTIVDGASTVSPKFTTARIFDVEASFAGEMTGELLGLALSPDGSKIYVGTKEEGLWMASTSNFQFTKRSSIVVQCLATRGNELWACSAEVSGFIAGVSTDDGMTFTSKLPLLGALTGPIACAAGANEAGAACNTGQNASQCGPAYQNFCSYYTCGIPEGGTGGTGNDEGKPTPPQSSSGSSGCDVSFGGVCRCGGGAMLAAGFAIAAVAVRRKRRRRG
jgi:hypothetical protein